VSNNGGVRKTSNFRAKCLDISKQESLANAKVSSRQQCVCEGPVAKKSMTNQRKKNVGYNSVAIFIRLAVVASKSAKSRKILRKFKLTAVQGHPRSLTLMSIESTYATSYSSLIVTMNVSLTIIKILMHLA